MTATNNKSLIERKLKNPSGFIYNIVKKYENMLNQCPSVDKDDMIQIGWEKLLGIQENWDEDRGAKFTTFAYIAIKNKILDRIRFWNDRTKYEVSYSNNELLKREALSEEDVVSRVAEFEYKIENLPRRQQKVASLYMEGYTQEEIGEKLGCSQKTISNVLKEI